MEERRLDSSVGVWCTGSGVRTQVPRGRVRRDPESVCTDHNFSEGCWAAGEDRGCQSPTGQVGVLLFIL